MVNIFFDIGLIIVVATFFAYIAKLLNQPLIAAHILTGLILGPFLGLITESATITTLSEIGIAFLLFIVGLEIDIKRLRNVGLVSSLGGIIKSLMLFGAGFLIAMALGFVRIEAVYIGIIVTFSSTMIVVKLLADKRELDTLHGRIILGLLLMEDIIAIFVLSALTSLSNFSLIVLVISVIKALAMLVVAVFASKFIFPYLFKFAARNLELLFLLALTAVFLFSMLFTFLGFSIVIGAFVAGVSLANLPYNIEIASRIKPLRDFFATIFFVSLGLGLGIGSISKMIIPLVVFVFFILLLKPLITMFVCSFFGYKRRTSFLTGMSLAQISEFSLIIVAQGMALGHLPKDVVSFTVLLGIITITATSYFVKYEDYAYLKLGRIFKSFDRFTEEKSELEYKGNKKGHVILCGYNRIGYNIVTTLKKLKKDILIVDFNPEVIRKLITQKIPCIYGDIGDVEVLGKLNLKDAKIVISTVPTKRDNLLLIEKTKEANKKAVIYVTASQVDEALELYDAGADYVILPHFLGGEHISVLIEKFAGNIDKVIRHKLGHIKELKERKGLGHEHPEHH